MTEMRATTLTLAGLLIATIPSAVLAQDYPDALQKDLASSKFKAGDYQGALKDCTAELVATPLGAKLQGHQLSQLTTCAMAKHRLKDFPGALADVDKILGRSVGGGMANAYFLYLRGLINLDAGEHKAAIEDFSQAKWEMAFLLEIFWKRGIAYEAIGDDKNALADYDRAASRIPDAQKRKDLLVERMNRSPQVTDVDGKTYKTLAVGDQTWMTEDLAVRRLRDGTAIQGTRSYDWNAVNSTKLCPAGWHVPTEPEWRELAKRLGFDVRPRYWEAVDPKKPGAVSDEVVGLVRRAFSSTGPEQVFWSSTVCGNGMESMAFFFKGDSLRYDCTAPDKGVYPVRCLKGDPVGGPVRLVTQQEWVEKHKADVVKYAPGSKAPYPAKWPLAFKNIVGELHGHYAGGASGNNCDVNGNVSAKNDSSGTQIEVLCLNSKAPITGLDQKGRSYLIADPLPKACTVVSMEKDSAYPEYVVRTNCGALFRLEVGSRSAMEADGQGFEQTSRTLAWGSKFKR